MIDKLNVEEIDTNELLHKLHNDARTGFQGINKLYKKAHLINENITLKDVSDFVKNQPSYQLTKPIKKSDIKYSTIVSPNIRNNFQMDIMYLPDTTTTEGYKYLLTCIDVYSRMAFVQLLKTKTGQEVFDKFKFLLRKSGIPKNINVDLGSEFIDNKFLKFCEENDIKLWYSSVNQDNKNAIVERFHRTLRNIILKYKMATNEPYIRKIPDFIFNYNTTYHSTIKDYPLNIWNGASKNNQKISRVHYPFKVGDMVRTINYKNVFDKKSSLNTYTKKVYEITRIEGNSFYLDDLQKAFRGHELLLANSGDLTSDFDERIKRETKEKKIERELKRESIDENNIVVGKRERKAKRFFDEDS